MRPPRALVGDRAGSVLVEFAVGASALLLLATAAISALQMQLAMGALNSGAAMASRVAARAPLGETRNALIETVMTNAICPAATGSGDYCWWDRDASHSSAIGSSGPLGVSIASLTDQTRLGLPEPFTDTGAMNGRWDSGEQFSDVNGNGVWDANMDAQEAGGAGDLVAYTFTITQPLRHPLLVAAMGSSVDHSVTMVVRNELW